MDRAAMTTEDQGETKGVLLERENQAFNRAHAAWIAIQSQLVPFGNGYPTQDSVDEYYAAEGDWKEIQAEMRRSAL